MRRIIVYSLVIIAGLGVGVAAVVLGLRWKRSPGPDAAAKPAPSPPELTAVTLPEQTMRGLDLRVQPVERKPYPRTLEVPGVVADLPGHCDYSVPTPIAGVVSRIAPLLGDIIRPGDPLFTIRLVGESKAVQSDLYTAAVDVRLTQELIARLQQSGSSVPEGRIFDAGQQLRRQEATLKTLRNDLLARGFSNEQIDGVQMGTFLTEITVNVPPPPARHASHSTSKGAESFVYEVQELSVKYGQQVAAGEVIVVLANHHFLMIEGRVFDSEAGLAAAAADSGEEIAVEFPGLDRTPWPDMKPVYRIRSLGNTVDPASRTLPFYVPLENQSKSYLRDGKPYLIWRYRPGQRVRLRLPVETIPDVFVVPLGAVVKDGVESFVYRQSGDTFQRRPVRVVYEDRHNAVLAGDSGISAGQFIVTNNAAAVERARKAAQAKLATGNLKPGGHWHADGSYHEAHD